MNDNGNEVKKWCLSESLPISSEKSETISDSLWDCYLSSATKNEWHNNHGPCAPDGTLLGPPKWFFMAANHFLAIHKFWIFFNLLVGRRGGGLYESSLWDSALPSYIIYFIHKKLMQKALSKFTINRNWQSPFHFIKFFSIM